MATWPAKTNYATGDVLTAAQMNDIGGELNDLYTTAGSAAGKNKIINGDFGIWQRGTSFSTAGTYSADRMLDFSNGGTLSITQQTFTPGTAPVAGYEGTYFLRHTLTGGSYAILQQRIEDVRTFANQTVTLSYWAKCSSGTVANDPHYVQNFGSGGTAEGASVAIGSTATITTSWQRFTHTVTIASISGKTIGAGSYLAIRFYRCLSGTQTVDIWGVQLEAGSVATAFQTATGSIQGELAACQRYYYRFDCTTASGNYTSFAVGQSASATTAAFVVPYPVTMRTNPSFNYNTSASVFSCSKADNTAGFAVSLLALDIASDKTTTFNATCATGLVAGNATKLYANNNKTAYLEFSAEL